MADNKFIDFEKLDMAHVFNTDEDDNVYYEGYAQIAEILVSRENEENIYALVKFPRDSNLYERYVSRKAIIQEKPEEFFWDQKEEYEDFYWDRKRFIDLIKS